MRDSERQRERDSERQTERQRQTVIPRETERALTELWQARFVLGKVRQNDASDKCRANSNEHFLFYISCII